MIRIFYFGLSIILLASMHSFAQEMVPFDPFGTLYIYPTASHPHSVVLMVSGDGGWRGSVVNMARLLSNENSFIAGIDIRQYLFSLKREHVECSDAAADFQALSKFLVDRYHLSMDQKPVLIGYSSGATLVYGTLVQAPANTFRGAISFGFCPDLPLTKPLCNVEWTRGAKGHLSFLPAKNLQNPWYAFQGMTDQVCNEGKTADYVDKVPNGKFVLLPRVGHGFRKSKNWLSEFRDAFKEITRTS